ncbi:hypothetical protein [Vibrio penaeicida]|uniref:Uncharacterized protein n=1 Tax=Vibrio penaeicida TaxID=104609 RepID=A0AAV5NKB6_9VIBR|nr:hypothetical protein [Vibrio penaeicida]RTZ23020.1 hypothetical protein EKN09_11090 [Vibrio penaeicida]GLQ71049.1 hypothetical protein GCM10007932_04090 [Vibrio penaeicida]
MIRVILGCVMALVIGASANANPRNSDIFKTHETQYKWYGIYIGMTKKELDLEVTSFKSKRSLTAEPLSQLVSNVSYATNTGVSTLAYAGIRQIEFYWSDSHELKAYLVQFEPTEYQQWLDDLPMFFDGFDTLAPTNNVGVENRLISSSIQINTSNDIHSMLVTQ